MSKIEIDFNNLKYNLYEILNVPSDSDEIKIKKSFMKIIKNFHPDKNSELEEDIYYHIILANQILLNKESRKKYDTFLFDRADTFGELKDSFNKTILNIEKYFPDKDTSKNHFNSKFEELNKKHGIVNTTSENITEKFNKIKASRSNQEFQVEIEDIKSNTEFNQKFNSHKSDGGKFKDMIVEYKGTPSELSTYVIGENYTNLADIDKLYVEDSVQCSKFSSLDRAFTLLPVTKDVTIKTQEEKMKEYQNQTEIIKNMKTTDFVDKKFSDW